MKKITKQELIKLIESEFSMTIEQIKKESMYNLDKYGCCKEFKSGKGFSVRYASNKNFCGGVNNGYGPGLYAKLRYTGFIKDIKLAE